MSCKLVLANGKSAFLAADRRMKLICYDGSYRLADSTRPKLAQCGRAWVAVCGDDPVVDAVLAGQYETADDLQAAFEKAAVDTPIKLSPQCSAFAIWPDFLASCHIIQQDGRSQFFRPQIHFWHQWPPDLGRPEFEDLIKCFNQRFPIQTLPTLIDSSSKASEFISTAWDWVLLQADGSTLTGKSYAG